MPEMAGAYTTGYVAVRWPCARLRIETGSIALHARPAWMATAFNGALLAPSSPAEIETIFPSEGMLRAPMVGLRTVEGRTYYFRPGRTAHLRAGSRTATMLDLCEQAGFPVSREVRRIDLTR
ncbi:hypothetical protein EHYA_09775 [Embleya hyalina]|uniref:Uncharacterized protein n=1 Tax=Embleya hyalina TaxID=516124 RepID=A0A401Z567_9ACTN|nr:hypothetical protein EHYA_09775 [Embleya hyalina]